ncbi:MAG TPA: ClpXP protease specificity-enhancing factor [Parasulfuritortus sp.]
MDAGTISQQPYFLRALYEWCVDNGFTPYVTVKVDKGTKVPPAYVKDGQIVLNIGPAAVRNLNMDNNWVTFSARFGGVSQTIEVPVANVLAIYARETGEGMSFSQNLEAAPENSSEAATETDEPPTSGPDRPKKGRPSLRVVK